MRGSGGAGRRRRGGRPAGVAGEVRAGCRGRVKTALVLQEARKVRAALSGAGGEPAGLVFDQLGGKVLCF